MTWKLAIVPLVLLLGGCGLCQKFDLSCENVSLEDLKHPDQTSHQTQSKEHDNTNNNGGDGGSEADNNHTDNNDKDHKDKDKDKHDRNDHKGHRSRCE